MIDTDIALKLWNILDILSVTMIKSNLSVVCGVGRKQQSFVAHRTPRVRRMDGYYCGSWIRSIGSGLQGFAKYMPKLLGLK